MPPGFDAEAGSGAAIRAKHEARLLAYPNVVGVTEGMRMRRGKLTNEPVIAVLVSRKVPRKRLTKASLLPSHIGGIPIDVFYQTGTPPDGLWLPDPAVAPYRGRG